MISESMDRELPLHQRVMIRIHLAMCKYCSRFRRQLLFIKAACHHLTEPFEDIKPAITLPAEARERIKAALVEKG